MKFLLSVLTLAILAQGAILYKTTNFNSLFVSKPATYVSKYKNINQAIKALVDKNIKTKSTPETFYKNLYKPTNVVLVNNMRIYFMDKDVEYFTKNRFGFVTHYIGNYPVLLVNKKFWNKLPHREKSILLNHELYLIRKDIATSLYLQEKRQRRQKEANLYNNHQI